MSDFFSHLAGRALGVPPVIRPRLQSLYERAGDSFSDVGAVPALVTHADDNADVPRTAIPKAIHETSAEQHIGGPSFRQSPGDQSAPRSSERPSETPRADGLAVAAVARSAPEHSSFAPATIEHVVDAPTTTPERVGSQPAPDNDVPRRRDDPARVGEDRGAPAPTSTVVVSRSIDSPSTKTGMRIVGKAIRERPDVPSSEAAADTPPVSRIAHNRSSLRQDATTHAAPAVHVTIGRVEIRAVTAPTPARQAAASVAPQLSLDDYLKRNAVR